MGERGREQDHYAVLGVARTATPAEIRAAFRAQARRWHPDFNPGDRMAERRMQAVNVAFETLSCPLRRREYDRWLAGGTPQPGADRPAGARPSARPMSAAERAEAWARARSARAARDRWEAARPRPRRTSVAADSLGPVLTAVTVGAISMVLFWHALPGPRPQPRVLAEALGLQEPRRTALARYAPEEAGMPVAPPSTEPGRRVVIEPPAARSSAGPAAPGAGRDDGTRAGTDAATAQSRPGPEPGRATLAELAEAARRGEAAAMAWQPRAADPAVSPEAAAAEAARLAALGSAAEAAAAWRAADLADRELRRQLLAAERERAEAAQRLARLDAELESARRLRRVAESDLAARPVPDRLPERPVAEPEGPALSPAGLPAAITTPAPAASDGPVGG